MCKATACENIEYGPTLESSNSHRRTKRRGKTTLEREREREGDRERCGCIYDVVH